MIIAFIICLIIALVFLERKWAAAALTHLTYDTDFDAKLVDQDQVITCTTTVENHSRLPVLYMGLNEYYPMSCQLEEQDEWKLKYTRSYLTDQCVRYRTWIMPWSRFIATKRMSFHKRGAWDLGKYYLETGDFLGFSTEVVMKQCRRKIIVMPKRCTRKQVVNALGGFIGDISVRRFILEDPILTLGFRDYTGREPMKSISWQQTARAGKLMVKQYDHTVDANVTVLLNLTSATKNEAECALEITRTVCETLEQKKIPYDFYTNGDFEGPLGQKNIIGEGLGPQHLTNILYGLGQMQNLVMFSFEKLTNLCIEDHRHEQSYLLISAELNEGDAAILRKLQAASDYQIGRITAWDEEKEKDSENHAGSFGNSVKQSGSFGSQSGSEYRKKVTG